MRLRPTGLWHFGQTRFASATTGLAITAGLYFRSSISRTALFWVAFVLTRPLGATVGDFLDKPLADGGLALSRYAASAALATVMVLLILALPQRAERQPA